MKRFGFVILMAFLITATAFSSGQQDASKQAVQLYLIIAEGKPDSENAAYNFADFEKATGYKVVMEAGPYSSFFQKANTDLVTAQGRYDVVWSTNMAAFGPYLSDLKDRWNKLPASERNDFFPATVEAMYSTDGKMVGLPWKYPIGAFYYRKDLFAENGLNPPRTLEEWRAVERKLTTATMYGGGWPAALYALAASKFYGLAASIVDPKVQVNPFLNAENRFTLNAPWNVQALQWLVDGYRKDKVYPPEILELQHYDVGRRFMSGVTATQYEWMWLYSQSQDPSISQVVGKVGIGPLPKGPGGRMVGYVSAQGFGVNAASKHQEEAWELAKWLTSKQALINTMKFFTWESPRKSSWSIPEVDPGIAKSILEIGASVDTPPLIHNQSTALRELVAKYIQQALLGALSAQQALDKAQAEAQQYQ